MLRSTRQMLDAAQRGGYAIGAFNVYNLEGVTAVIEAAEAENSPVILQLHPTSLEFGGLPLVRLCLAAAEQARIPASVHLDHSASAEAIRFAVGAGMRSIMADGSHLTYDANVAFTHEMAGFAHAHDATVEAELGRISGTEDGLTVADFHARMTVPEQAAAFVRATQVDALAVCVGNVHGPYPGEPMLDFARLAAIQSCVDVPLVMHGASGLPAALIRRSIELGICKFNVNTELRAAYIVALKARLAAEATADLVALMQGAIAAMRAVVVEKLRLFGSAGRAT